MALYKSVYYYYYYYNPPSLLQCATRQSQTADFGEVALIARKVVPCVRWPATGITAHSFSQAQGCVCTALQLGGDVEQPWLMTSSIKAEVYNVSLRHQQDRATAIGNVPGSSPKAGCRSSLKFIH